MAANSTWRTLQRHLKDGAVLRYVAGFSIPIAVGRDCRFHDHAEIELVFHPRGRGVTTMQQGQCVSFKEGDAVLYAPGVRHDQKATEAGIDCCIQIAPPPALRLTGHMHIGCIDDIVLRAELEYLSNSSSAIGTCQTLLNLRATTVLLQLIALQSTRANTRTSRLEQHVIAAERYVHEHYASIRSVDEIAAATGVGRDHLRYAFRHQRGKSVIGYLTEVRLTQARTLLAHTALTLKEIASLCGYCDEYYLSAVFRKRFGYPPGLCRDRA